MNKSPSDKVLEASLHRCGKKIYVTYFDYWNQPGFDEKKLWDLMIAEGKDPNGIKMCIQSAKKIAELGKQSEALKIIVNSPRVEANAREKARQILQTYH